MPRGSGGNVAGFKLLSTPNAPGDFNVSPDVDALSVSFTAPSDTGDADVTSYVVTAVNESTGVSTGTEGSSSPIALSTGAGTFKVRAQAINSFGPGQLTEFSTGNSPFAGFELYTWNRNNYGQLGDGTTTARSSPVQIGALTTWSSNNDNFGGGSGSSFGIKTDSTLWAWGSNQFGKLGDNTSTNRSSPVQIGADTNWRSISGAQFSTAATRTNNTLWTWGWGINGELGDGTSAAAKSSPIQIGALTNWSRVEMDSYGSFCVSVKTDGTLWTWGNNSHGALGDGTTVNKSSPIQVGSLTTWYQVSAAQNHWAALKTDGTFWTCGNGDEGQLGIGTSYIRRSSPVQVGSLTTWALAAAGGRTTFGIKTDGTLWAWGRAQFGVLGNGTTSPNKNSPIQIGALTNWSHINLGYRAAVAIKTDRTLWAWGDQSVGDGTTTSRSSPVQIGTEENWFAAKMGSYHFIASVGV